MSRTGAKKWMLVCMAVLVFACAACSADKDSKGAAVSIDGLKVVVDAGHGDTDAGTIGVFTGRQEKEVNLEIAKKLQKALEQEGAKVVMTRESDAPIAAAEETDIAKRKEADMQKRERIITDAKADMYIGVHQNSFENAETCGPQVFYHTDSSVGNELAKCIQKVMNEELEIKAPRKANCGRYRLLKPGRQPSVTVECGFFTNQDEEKKLQTDDYQDKVVKSIVDGIKSYELEYGDVKQNR
ncbi:MAG: N-acetylmuramoyl-L-alanine amidase [Christensenella sp.]